MNTEIFKKGLNKLDININADQIRQFEMYSELLKDWNEKINLTAITDDDGISVKHFLDSILPLKYVEIPAGAVLADIGTGAGFPGIPLKIMRSDLEVTLIDSLSKRVNFLNTVSDALCLSGIKNVHGRAEELSKDNKYREHFDVVVSRAVANMTVLCEYCLPYVKTGGIFIALKARDAEDEIEKAKPMTGNLGGSVEGVFSAPLPQSDIVRTIAVIRKVKPTPASFPRSAKRIKATAK